MTLFATVPLLIATAQATQGESSEGSLKLEQAAYDVQSYDITIKAEPSKKAISGKTIMEAKTVIPTASILVDLDDPYTVSKVTDGKGPLRFERLEVGFYFKQSRMIATSFSNDSSLRGPNEKRINVAKGESSPRRNMSQSVPGRIAASCLNRRSLNSAAVRPPGSRPQW